MQLSCAFAPTPETPALIEYAESLGYERAWVYDTPALQLDVWMTLALAATRTNRIVLGPGVLIPSLRHPMVTASAIAHLVELVGEHRVIVGVGTGFTGRRAMGQKPLRWDDMPAHIAVVQSLLRGETCDVEGKQVKMLHWPGQASARPIHVPWVVGVNGPRGIATAASLGCGVFTSRPRADASYGSAIPSVTLLAFGTVLDPGESPASERVMATAGPGVAVGYHAFLEQHDDRLAAMPNSDRFVELAQAVPEAQRHLHLHAGHLTNLNPIDRAVITPEAAALTSIYGTAEQVRAKIAAYAAAGITEIAYQPMGPDQRRELRVLAETMG